MKVAKEGSEADDVILSVKKGGLEVVALETLEVVLMCMEAVGMVVFDGFEKLPLLALLYTTTMGLLGTSVELSALPWNTNCWSIT